ncbi:MAG: NAD(P)-dependent oxidoreductase [Pseudomonadota bacterium]
MHSLPIFVRLIGKTVILIGDGEIASPKRRLLERAGAVVCNDECADARLAFVAMLGGETEAIALRLKARGLLVNVVDRPDLCDFTMPAILDRDPVLIAVGTGGASAGLAKTLRQRLDHIMPPSLGVLAAALGKARAAMRVRWPDSGDFRRTIDTALSEGGALDPMYDHAPDAVDVWLAQVGEAQRSGQLVHIRLTSEDPDMLTLRDARLLGSADALWHKGDVPDGILDRARADATRHIVDAPPSTSAAGLHLWLEIVS